MYRCLQFQRLVGGLSGLVVNRRSRETGGCYWVADAIPNTNGVLPASECFTGCRRFGGQLRRLDSRRKRLIHAASRREVTAELRLRTRRSGGGEPRLVDARIIQAAVLLAAVYVHKRVAHRTIV